jgi:DoxX-like family
MANASANNPSPLSLDDRKSRPAPSPAQPLAGGCPDRVPKGRLWTGRVLSALAVLFLLFDAVGKLIMPAPVAQAFARLGFPTSLGLGIGILLLICTLLYAIPRTAILGAVVLTGFLGGAVAIQLRAGSPLFETDFPVLFGLLVWAGIYLRDNRLRKLIPLRCLG